MKTLLILIAVLVVLGGGAYAGWAFWYKPMHDRQPVPASELKGVRLGEDIEDVQFAFGALLKHAHVGEFEVYQYPMPAPAEGEAAGATAPGAPATPPAAGDTPAAAAGAGAANADTAAKPLRVFTREKIITGVNYRCTGSSDSAALDQVHCGHALKDLVLAYPGLDLRQYCTSDDPLLRFIDLPRLGKSFFLQANRVAELWIRRPSEPPEFLDGERWQPCGHKHPRAL